ncbi:Protein of unknown function [Amycolatopsis arida]|uniref:DUF4232 domain-containing protein n=1 Tax=Amycolatopsis arida TaxID=587909 RepID=A0A1I5YL34_9PSEU|nr:DUF4232 domain-containing protein [Amycolatopsis arida]TDX90594.1 uncharacterized protein DUF4232 [Amycolatopsis arida]SFQ44923.1 Protein of unknown function [Amycolatopsis arida]
MTRGRVAHLALIATGTALTAAIAGCGQGGQPATPPTTTETVTTTVTETVTQEKSVRPTDGEPALCTAGDVALSLGRGSAAAGTAYRPLQFTNTSDHSCVLHGYPGVSYVTGDDGHQVGPAAYRDGEKGAPVVVAPGEKAHAPLGFVQVRNYDPAVCRPTPVRGLRVYLPQETDAKFLEHEGTGCASDEIPGHQLVVRTIEKGPGEP